MPKPTPTPSPVPPVVAPTPVVPAPVTPTPSAPLPFDTPQNSRHSFRVMCDNAGLSIVPNVLVDGKLYTPKDILCACVEEESGFRNFVQGSTTIPVTHKNYVKGVLSSTDWGMFQINDYWHIKGCGKAAPWDFPSVAYVIDNVPVVAQFMIDCYKAGELDLWDSYLLGGYKKYLPQ